MSAAYSGFHYVDWHFDGDSGRDIIMLIRTAYRGAVSYHNSNRITFLRTRDWRIALPSQDRAACHAPENAEPAHTGQGPVATSIRVEESALPHEL